MRAEAYECTKVSDGSVSQAWLSRCVPYAISARNDRLLDAASIATIQRSFDAWAKVSCSDFSFMHVGFTTETEAFDVTSPETQFNAIAFLESWKESPIPEQRLLALTLTHFVIQTGEILDADIIFNADDFDFVDVDSLASCVPASDSKIYDLENTLVHEIGHFVGFDHVSARASTMFAEADACETSKRSLDADDEKGLCDVYPSGAPVATCLPPPGGYEGELETGDFRGQCDRYTSGERAALTIEEARALSPPGGCSCSTKDGVVARRSERQSWPWMALFGLVVLGCLRRSQCLRR